jgi:hypothetical protein
MKSCSRCGIWKQDREFYLDRRTDSKGRARMRRIYHERKAA